MASNASCNLIWNGVLNRGNVVSNHVMEVVIILSSCICLRFKYLYLVSYIVSNSSRNNSQLHIIFLKLVFIIRIVWWIKFTIDPNFTLHLIKIALDIWSILFNYLLPDIDKGLTVFILILLLTSPIFKSLFWRFKIHDWNGSWGEYSDSIIYHKISKEGVKDSNLKTDYWVLLSVLLYPQ